MRLLSKPDLQVAAECQNGMLRVKQTRDDKKKCLDKMMTLDMRHIHDTLD